MTNKEAWVNYYVGKDGNVVDGGVRFNTKEKARETAERVESSLRGGFRDSLGKGQGIILAKDYSHHIQLPEVV
jgi:hypothetical protein